MRLRRPRTAASSRILRSPGLRASRRAATSPRSVDGSSPASDARSPSSVRTPASLTSETSSSRKKGLPPLRSSSTLAQSPGRSPRRGGRAAAAGLVVERVEVEDDASWPPAGDGVQRSSSARRAVARSTKGSRASRSSSVVDEVEHGVVGPVQVGEHHDDRALGGRALDAARPPSGWPRRGRGSGSMPRERAVVAEQVQQAVRPRGRPRRCDRTSARARWRPCAVPRSVVLRRRRRR